MSDFTLAKRMLTALVLRVAAARFGLGGPPTTSYDVTRDIDVPTGMASGCAPMSTRRSRSRSARC